MGRTPGFEKKLETWPAWPARKRCGIKRSSSEIDETDTFVLGDDDQRIRRGVEQASGHGGRILLFTQSN
jgi:hypothetical protein